MVTIYFSNKPNVQSQILSISKEEVAAKIASWMFGSNINTLDILLSIYLHKSNCVQSFVQPHLGITSSNTKD